VQSNVLACEFMNYGDRKCALLPVWGIGPELPPTLLLIAGGGRFSRLSARVQLPTQLVTLPFGLYSSPTHLAIAFKHPYLKGEVTLETTVSPMQRPGTYRLDSIKLLTAGHKEILVQEVPEDRIRILPEPSDPPHIDQWEVGGEYQA
jgi:hypothetical protein